MNGMMDMNKLDDAIRDSLLREISDYIRLADGVLTSATRSVAATRGVGYALLACVGELSRIADALEHANEITESMQHEEMDVT